MAIHEEKKAFVLKAIAPYYQDPTKCGFNMSEVHCEYLSSNGNKCVLGQFLLNPDKFSANTGAITILRENKEEDILKPEAIDKLTAEDWKYLQGIHDSIAYLKFGTKEKIDKYKINLQKAIERLDLFTEDELKEYVKKNLEL